MITAHNLVISSYGAWVCVDAAISNGKQQTKIFLTKYQWMVTLFATVKSALSSDCLRFLCSSIVARMCSIYLMVGFAVGIACKRTKQTRFEWINYIMLEINERYFNWFGFSVHTSGCIAYVISFGMAITKSTIKNGMWPSSIHTHNRFKLSLQYAIWQFELRLLVIESKGPVVFSTLYAMD